MSDKLPVVAIIGRANVGKSSLFNRLAGERRAIVDDTSGTTRDRVEAIVEWNGQPFWLLDTAGFEYDNHGMAAPVQEQIQIAREMADLLLITLDGSTILSDEDHHVIKDAHRQGAPFLIAINKADHRRQPLEADKLPDVPILSVSAIHGTGSGDLLDAITRQLPTTTTAQSFEYPTLALLGRPNVGKSSLLNALSGSQRSVVAETAGTTRDVAEIVVSDDRMSWQLADTAGLRRRSQLRDIEYFSYTRTLDVINRSHICILVIDATEPATSQDQRIAGMIKEAGKGLIIALNKWDLTERGDDTRARLESVLAAQLPFVWWAPLILTSAATQHNISKILTLAADIWDNWQQSFSTRELNEALEQATLQHPPAGLKNRHPKLNYITQTDTCPPTFAVYGSHTYYLHWSYKRYLENYLREQFELMGTPIRLQWRSKNGQRTSTSKKKGESS